MLESLPKNPSKEKIAPIAPAAGDPVKDNKGQIDEGTYGGTQLAVTEIYDRVTQGYDFIISFFCPQLHLHFMLYFSCFSHNEGISTTHLGNK